MKSNSMLTTGPQSLATKKRQLSDAVWCEGAILKHSESGKVFLAPSSFAYGIVYEIIIEDLLEIVSTGALDTHLDREYKIIQIYFDKNL